MLPLFGTAFVNVYMGFAVSCRRHLALKARATWQWWNFLEGVLPPGRQLLRLNLDETACRLYLKPRKGDLADKTVAAALREASLVQDVDAGQQKAALSLMALICDVPSLQPDMPQVILGNGHILKQAQRGRACRPPCMLTCFCIVANPVG